MGVTAVCCQQEACAEAEAPALDGVSCSSHMPAEPVKPVATVEFAGEQAEPSELVDSAHQSEARLPCSAATQASKDQAAVTNDDLAKTKGAETETTLPYKDFEICAQRGSDGSIGLDLRHAGTHLTVVAIHPHRRADVESWTSSTGQTIIVGDKIIAVNDVAGSDATMVETCRRFDNLTFRIRRDAYPF
mmetsp:Transcript_19723/g.35725  ORF Transcript_19723/g.35725 Transcript_19723/m.35725 type:complete len:189 (-) Transcript_19723:145-711(-)